MATDLQRRKVSRVFAALDANGDGFLEESDFAALAARWIQVRGPGDHQLLEQIMLGWWATLLAASDLDRDNKVTLDEVLLVVDELPGMPEAVTGTAAAMFEAIDANQDGLISAAEYRQLIEVWNGRPTDTDAIFPALDADGDGRLSHEEFSDLWYEFWAGDDADAPGTLVFGPL
ncbi:MULTISPECIES: EF-hand domain-containing protein [unclassified Crossiella]|uniref:EF-hand domain-containing protein n=1 Tax=unclassified Crossiella TaxID=2620835 RepID=UPI001FFFAF5E|nr:MULTISPECIES: EF-hand domain-containing protein [unclassified Crossiella]MCK2242649.1 EF-hand domain-containing protein [Crossiella sp. S99.2]MCK2256526.1 EF-hand domain-containing protein [Crossiella sp. S99.1]